MTNWQPITDAQKDGRHILATWAADPMHMELVHWDGNDFVYSWDGSVGDNPPTHFLPEVLPLESAPRTRPENTARFIALAAVSADGVIHMLATNEALRTLRAAVSSSGIPAPVAFYTITAELPIPAVVEIKANIEEAQ